MKNIKLILLTFAVAVLGFQSLALAQEQTPPCPAPGPSPTPAPPPHDPWQDVGVSLRYLNFWYTGPGCFFRVNPNYPIYLSPILQQGAVFVETTQGIRVMAPFDPLKLTRFTNRNTPEDMVAATPYGVGLFPRYGQLPQGAVEVFQRPPEGGLCNYGF